MKEIPLWPRHLAVNQEVRHWLNECPLPSLSVAGQKRSHPSASDPSGKKKFIPQVNLIEQHQQPTVHRVGKAKVLPLDISCNSTKMSDYKIVTEMGASKFILLKEINRDDDWGIINVRATIITKEERTENKKVITIRQHEGPTIEVTFWVMENVVKKESEPEWHPNLKHLMPKMFCSFIGLQVRHESNTFYLNSSEFTPTKRHLYLKL